MSQALTRSRTLTALKRYATVPLRLIVGYGFLAHGMAKWSKGVDSFAAILSATHVPAPHIMAWLTIFTEIFGGLAILCGAFVAILLLIVAIFTVHLPYGFTSIKLMKIVDGRPLFGPPGYECDLLYIACIVTLVLSGPSPWSVDAYRLRHEGGPSTLFNDLDRPST
jgi:putative oxidoreductase